MTRINTNVSSLQAQINLSRNNNELQTALTRLSTGLRINSGKDDPAGLIASETLRSDIKATEVGITNSERANQMIATADSALGQVSSLLIDIRGLVNEAANTGAMSAAQIAANQLQVDSSLDAIDRISQVTQFQGSRLIDGSLDFTTEGVDNSAIDSVQIDQASFGSNPTIGVNVELISQATKGNLVYDAGQTTDDLVLQVGGSDGFQAFSFDAGTSISDMASAINLVSEATGVTAVAEGVLEWEDTAGVSVVGSYGANNDITITANTAGELGGAYYVRYFTAGGVDAATSATITQSSETAGEITYGYIDVTLGTSAASAAVYTGIGSGLNDSEFATGTIDLSNATSGGTGAASLTWTTNDEGAADAPTIVFVDSTVGTGYAFDATTNVFTVTQDFSGATSLTAGALATALDGIAENTQYDFADNASANDIKSDTGGTLTLYAEYDTDGEGANGVQTGGAIDIDAESTVDGVENDFSIVFTNASTGGGTSTGTYNAGTNTYTINIDNSNAGAGGAEFTMTEAELITRLTNATGAAHTFTAGGSGGGTLDINVVTQDWAATALTDVEASTAGSDGGVIDATANDVIDAINSAQDALVGSENRIFTVANATGNDGSGTVTISEVVATTGTDPGQDADANNMVQFMALDGMRDIQYVASGKNTALSIDLNTYEPEYANAMAIIDLGIENGTIQLTANSEGEDGNQSINIVWNDNSGGGTAAEWDSNLNGGTLTIDVDTDPATTSIDDIIDAINSATTAGGSDAIAFTAGSAKAPTAPSTVPEVGTSDTVYITDVSTFDTTAGSADLEGGVVSEGVMVVNLATDANGNVTTTANDLIAFIEASDEQVLKDFQLVATNGGASDGTGTLSATTSNVKFDPAGTTYTDAYASGATHAAYGSTAQFTVTSKTAGSDYDNVLVRVALDDENLVEGTGAVTWLEDSNTLLVTYNGDFTAEQVSYLINEDDTVGAMFTAEPTAGEGAGTGNVNDGDFVYLSGGETRTVPDPTTYTPPLAAGDPMVQLIGGLDAGEDVSDAKLTFNAANYGSSSFVSVKAISGTFAVQDTTGATVDRSYGTDVQARINGIMAVGDGLNASLSTASLQMQLGIDANMTVGESSSFSITGGGAQFQLGPDVVSNQQARLGIMSVSSATLGGINGHGRLFELRSGEAYDLSTDTTGAASVVEDVITQVTGLRGRLGAFQKTTLETNIASLQDTLETLTAAESSIRDADFAEESSALTRAQILVQSSTKVLGIANQGPQNVLSLIQ